MLERVFSKLIHKWQGHIWQRLKIKTSSLKWLCKSGKISVIFNKIFFCLGKDEKAWTERGLEDMRAP